MPAKRAQGAKAPTSNSATKPKSSESSPSLLLSDASSLAQYVSVLGVHLILVGFTALYLPQTTRLFVPLTARKKMDRQQSEFIEALTMDPLSTLGWILAGLVVVEVWWANWMWNWSFNQSAIKGTADEIKIERMRFDGLRFAARIQKLKDATAFTMCATVAIYLVVVAFGAPLTTHILQTALLSLVLGILTVFAPAFVLGLPSFASDTPSLARRLTWTRLFVELSPKNTIERTMVYSGVGTFVGGWLGAIPIALDWDRPWQAWPLTTLFGSIGGYIVGSLVALTLSTARYLATEHLRSQPSKVKNKTS